MNRIEIGTPVRTNMGFGVVVATKEFLTHRIDGKAVEIVLRNPMYVVEFKFALRWKRNDPYRYAFFSDEIEIQRSMENIKP